MEYMWNTADQNSVDSAFPKRFQEMAFAMPNGSASTAAIDEGFFCPVCLEILQDPTSIPCGHTFCASCLQSSLSVNPATASCPMCRTEFNPRRQVRETDLDKTIHSTRAPCPDCGMRLFLSAFRAHNVKCQMQGRALKFTPVAPTSQTVSRSTFNCPYCSEMNLDVQSMLKHVNSQHRHETLPVVCPVCASMPWGNPGQKSGNFIQHLNLRHKFEYDTYVDYNEDENEVLRRVLEQSMSEH